MTIIDVNTKVPVIRFDGYSKEWKKKELREVTDYQNGKSHEDKQKSSGSYELINLNSISIDGGLKKSGKFIDDSDKTLNKNDLVMVLSDVGHGDLLGRVALIPENHKYVLNQRVALLRPNSEVIPIFLFYNINADQGYFKSQGAGMSQLNISRGSVESFTSYFPSKKLEQTKIGNLFQNLDSLISKHQQKHDKLKNIKKALLEKLFPQHGETIPAIRFKDFSGEWDANPLEDNAVFLKGRGYSKSDLTSSGTPVVLYGRLYTKYQTVITEIDSFVQDNGESVISKGNEVLVPASGETAEDISRASALLIPGIVLGGDLNIISPSLKISPVFLALAISNGKSQKELSKKAQGKSVVHIRNSDLKELNISYPKEEEQTKIGNLFQQIDILINQNQAQITKLKNIKQSLLNKMFI